MTKSVNGVILEFLDAFETFWQTPVSNSDRGIPWWEIRYMAASHHRGVRGQAALHASR